jgi:cell shape-determining protein MreD
MNRMMIIPLVGLLFAVMAKFGIVLPDSFTQDAVVTLVMLITATVTAFTRFMAGDLDQDVKHWFQSRVIITQIVTCLFAVLTLFGIGLQIVSVDGVVEVAMIASTLVTAFILRKPQAALI